MSDSNVQNLIDDARLFADGMENMARAELAGVQQQIARIEQTVTDPRGLVYTAPQAADGSDLLLDVPSPPSLPPPAMEYADKPVPRYALQDIDTYVPPDAPTNKYTAPEIRYPNQPSALPPPSLAVPVVNTNYKFPDPPAMLLNPTFQSPVMGTYTMPDAPNAQAMLGGITLPGNRPSELTDAAPKALDQTLMATMNAQNVASVTFANTYLDRQLNLLSPGHAASVQAMQARLEKSLSDGGTGLSAAVENAIYARSRNKSDDEAKKVRAQAYSEAASRGFTMPTGAMMSAIQQARQDAADANTKVAADIAISQAELEQKNLQFALTTIANLRTSLLNSTMSYFGNLVQINAQALEAGKAAAQMLVESFNSSVRYYEARLDGYKTDVSVYEAKIRAVMAFVDVYKGEIAGLEAAVNVDRSKVELYRSQIESMNALASVYRSQVEAVTEQASLEKLKVEVFGMQTQAYTAQVNAKGVEYQAYTALINGESTKAQVYQSQVHSFGEEVQAYKAKIDAKTTELSAKNASNEAKVREFSAQSNNYSTLQNANKEKMMAQVEDNRKILVEYQRQLQHALSRIQNAQMRYRTQSEINVETAKSNFAAALKRTELTFEGAKLSADVSKTAAQIFGGLATTAITGMNTLAAEIKYS